MDKAQEMPSIAIDIARFVESKGAGKLGVDLFAHDWPDLKNTQDPTCVLFIETATGGNNMLLSGEVSSQREFMSIFAKARSEKESRARLAPVITEVRKMVRVTIGQVLYMSILPVSPIHFVGTDKNDAYVTEMAFTVLRRPITA